MRAALFLDLIPVDGAQIQARIESAVATPADLVARLIEAIKYNGDPR